MKLRPRPNRISVITWYDADLNILGTQATRQEHLLGNEKPPAGTVYATVHTPRLALKISGRTSDGVLFGTKVT